MFEQKVDSETHSLVEEEQTFKQLERDYWNQRNTMESDISRLQKSYGRKNALQDDWGILGYLKRIAQESPGAKILEVAAGLGSQAIPLALQHNFPTVVTDLAATSVVANQKAVWQLSSQAPIYFSAADADQLPFRSASFDVVLIHAALHHLPVPRKTVREMARCLKPGGLLVLGHEPNRLIFEPLRFVADKLGLTEKHTQRFIEGSYSVADEETPGFWAQELRQWMAENQLTIEWLTPIWFVNAIFYNLPVVTQLFFKTKLSIPRWMRYLGQATDQILFAETPGIRNLGMFWSLGARKAIN